MTVNSVKRFRWVPLLLSVAISAGIAVCAAPGSPSEAVAQDPATERVYRAKCASCHGRDGKGQTKQGLKMKIADQTTAAWHQAHSDDDIRNTIRDGIPERTKNGVVQEMEPFRDKLRPAQIEALLQLIRSRRP